MGDMVVLIYTGSSDSEGTLGGLVEAGRRFPDHLTTCASGEPCYARTIRYAQNTYRIRHMRDVHYKAPRATDVYSCIGDQL